MPKAAVLIQKKNLENSDSNMSVQFMTETADVLEDSHCCVITSKQLEFLKIDTKCSFKNEEMRTQEKPIGKKSMAIKKKKCNRISKIKEDGQMDGLLDTKEHSAAVHSFSLLPPVTEAASTSVLTNVFERNSSVPLLEKTLGVTSQSDIPSEPTTSTTSELPKTNSKDEENAVETQQNECISLKPEGRKKYDREFLLQLISHPLSSCKLADIPNVFKYEAYKDYLENLPTKKKKKPATPVVNKRGQFSCGELFVPKCAPGALITREPNVLISQCAQRKGKELSKKDISFSISKNTKLHKSPNPWKPLHKSEIPLNEKDKLKRSILGILNKLTPEKFETLLAQFKNFLIDTEEKLDLVCCLIFEKAMNERMFCALYAKLSKHLALIKVPVSGTSGAQINFRKLLLTKCQKEFEYGRNNELENEEKKILKAADLSERKELQLKYEEEERKIRYRQLGNIRLIGELFKLGMIIEPIMHEHIKELLTQCDEKSLEYLAEFLKTIGKKLDEIKMHIYLAQIKLIVDKHLTSPRIRFLLQDIIDLEKNNWVPRRDENNPKTIDEIHKDAEREVFEQQLYKNKTECLNKIFVDGKRRKNIGQTNPSKESLSSSSVNSKRDRSVIDHSQTKLTKLDEGICLEPDARDTQSCDVLIKGFSDLSSSYEGRSGSKRSTAPSHEFRSGTNSQLPHVVRKKSPDPKVRKNLLKRIEELTKISEAKSAEVKATANVHVNRKEAATEDVYNPEYNEDDFERKTCPFRDKFHHNKYFEEAIKCVIELASPNTVHMFINATINEVFERSDETRYFLGQLLSSLLKKKILTFDQYKKGFTSIIEKIDDYAVNIPLIWDYMGEILEPMIEVETPFKLLKEVLQPCIPSEKAGLLISSILHCAIKRKGTIKLKEVWRESGVQWTDIIGTDRDVAEFIKKHKLEFTMSTTKGNPHTQISMEEIKRYLLSLLDENSELEEIFVWVDANISDTSDPTFVRALVTAVHESCLSGSGTTWELNTSKLRKRLPCIFHYVSTNEKLQLQVLHAVIGLVNQLSQPSGLLHQIFDVLYDDEVISDKTFKEWEQSDDLSKVEGKGIAVLSVKSSLTEETEKMNSV